jgi:hypothetical protein
MNIQRAITTLAQANAALQRKEFFSPDQLKAFRKAKRKAKAFINACTKPSAKPFPKPNNNQPTLFA